MAYEATKIYDIEGLRITSRVLGDAIIENPQPMRVIRVETSCESERWGIRKKEHTSTVPVDFEVESQLEETRRREAEILATMERGERPEEQPSFIAVKLHGAHGMSINGVAAVNLAIGPSLMSQEFIELLKLEESGQRYGQWTPNGMQEFPLYKLTIEFGKHTIETVVLPAQGVGVTCVIGGEFFAKALRDRPRLLYELISPDHVRALYNAARCKKKYVLITGKYGEARQRLTAIKAAIAETGFTGLILDELSDIEEQSLLEKFVTYASICRFVIMDDAAASGHLTELEACRHLQFMTGLLQPSGRPSTAMIAGVADETTYFKEFPYETTDGYVGAARSAALWADEQVVKRAQRWNRHRKRGPGDVLW